MAPLRVFSCFDVEHDADLHARLLDESEREGSRLSIVDWSRDDLPGPAGEDELHRRLSGVDALVVICGAFTEGAFGVSRELLVAQKQGKPYVLLRGRRSLDCTQPVAARPDDRLYTWIWDILTEQLAMKVRLAGHTAGA